jgi:hypothetical protein
MSWKFDIDSQTNDLLVSDGSGQLVGRFKDSNEFQTNELLFTDTDNDGSVWSMEEGSGATLNVDYGGAGRFEINSGGNVNVPNGQLSEQGNRVATRTWAQSEHTTPSEALSKVESADPLSLQNDLRLATGQSIEDGSGNKRVSLNSGQTKLKDQLGQDAFGASDGYANFIESRSATPFGIYDNESNSFGVQYDTGSPVGQLRTPNSIIRVQNDVAPTGGEGLELRYDAGNNFGYIPVRDRDAGSWKDLILEGDNIEIRANGGRVDLSDNPANLRLANDQAIEDGNGTERINLGDLSTKIKNDEGETKFTAWKAIGNFGARIYVADDEPFQIYDKGGAGIMAEYQSGTMSGGTFSLTNADIELSNSSITTDESSGVTPGVQMHNETVTNGSAIDLGKQGVGRGSGLYLISEADSHEFCMAINYSLGSVSIIEDPDNSFTNTQGNGGTTNIYVNSNNNVVLENQTGSDHDYRWMALITDN